MKAIIAVNRLGFIGLNDGLPWKSSNDLKHFKSLTMQSSFNEVPVLIAGYKTAQTLPNLKGRQVIVLPKSDSPEYETYFNHARHIDWCIGGKATYEKLCHLFTELHISYIDDTTIGDTMMPDLSNLNPNCTIYKYYYF